MRTYIRDGYLLRGVNIDILIFSLEFIFLFPSSFPPIAYDKTSISNFILIKITLRAGKISQIGYDCIYTYTLTFYSYCF